MISGYLLRRNESIFDVCVQLKAMSHSVNRLICYFISVFFGTSCLLFLGCQPNKETNSSHLETIEGDLSFKLIDSGSFYPLVDGLGEEVGHYIDSLNNVPPETLSTNEREFMNMVNLLAENDLLFLPSFLLQSDSINYRVYLDSTEYARVHVFDRNDLLKESKKVHIQLKGEIINTPEEDGFGIFRADKIVSLKKVEGKTEWRK